MDPDIAFWIIEYLLRHTEIDVDIVKRFLSVLPTVDDCHHPLKKAILLRQIQSSAATGSLSEEILDFLEIINELDKSNGVPTASQAMKEAYCAVAVECTLHVLKKSAGNRGREYYDSAVRIWRRRIRDEAERSGSGGLISDGLLQWRDEIETSIWDPSACAEMLQRESTSGGGSRLLNAYMAEAWEDMGPSFIDLAADYLIKTGNTEPGSLMVGVLDGAVPGLEATRHDISSGNSDSQSNKGSCENKSHVQDNVAIFGNRLMERNSTARAYEWNDSIEVMHEEKIGTHEKRVSSSSSKRNHRKRSPLEEQKSRDKTRNGTTRLKLSTKKNPSHLRSLCVLPLVEGNIKDGAILKKMH